MIALCESFATTPHTPECSSLTPTAAVDNSPILIKVGRRRTQLPSHTSARMQLAPLLWRHATEYDIARSALPFSPFLPPGQFQTVQACVQRRCGVRQILYHKDS